MGGGPTDNHAIGAAETAAADLLALKAKLRRLPDADRKAFAIGPEQLAAGYRALLLSAPKRKRPFFSSTRDGSAPADPAGRRREERLAMAWFNAGSLRLTDGGNIILLDYQFPLKERQTNAGIGKVDLLGLDADQALVVIELKVAGNREDRRIGLLEGLIYAAIVEANAQTILPQLEAARGHRVIRARPNVFLMAPHDFWRGGFPPVKAMEALAMETGMLIGARISLFGFDNEDADFGLDGTRPAVYGGVLLSPARA